MKSQNTDHITFVSNPLQTFVWEKSELLVRIGTKALYLDLLTSEQSVTAPYDYTASKSGKGLRTHLLSAFAEYIPVDEHSKDVIGAAVGMLHTATLM